MRKKLLIIGAAFALAISGCAGANKAIKQDPFRAVAGEEEIILFDFEDSTAHRTSGTNSFGTNSYSENGATITTANGDCVTTGTPINGTANFMGRLKKNVNSSSVTIGPIDCSEYNITTITYKTKGATGVKHQMSYSDGGTSYTTLGTATAFATSNTDNSEEVSPTGLELSDPENFYIKVNLSYSGSSTSNQDARVDDIAIYGLSTSGAETKSLSSIAVSDNSGKTWYAGDVVTASDLRVVATYDDDSSETITDGTGVSITSGATLSEGSNTVYVTYTDVFGSANGSVSISAAAAISLSSISITTPPTKTTYYEGEIFDPTGMVVTATYSDSSSSNVTANCTFSPSGSLSTSDDSITVSYTYKNVEKTTTQSITVNSVDEVTFTGGTDLGSTSSNNSPDSVSKYGFTVSGTNAAFATAEYRIYASSEVTFSVASGNIKKITIVKNGSYSLSLLSLKAGEAGTWNNSTGVWTGVAQSVTFAASAQFRANSFTIEKAPSGPTVLLDKDSISLKTNEAEGKQVTATTYNIDSVTYLWSTEDSNIALEGVTTATVTIKPDTENSGSATVTLTVNGTNGGDPITPIVLDVPVTISIPEPGETAGTAFTVAQASSAITAAESDIENVYIRGKISQIDEINVSSHYATYWISDSGTTEGQFKIYKGKYLNSADFTSNDQITVGDTVILFGTISKAYSNLNQNNYIVSLTPVPKVNSIVLTPSSIVIEPNASGDIVDLFTSITINQDDGLNYTANDIEWSSNDSDIFYILDGEYLAGDVHRASTTISASIGGKVYGTATVTIIDPSIYSISYNHPYEWALVSDISTLVPGDKVILTGVKSETVYAAGTYSSGNNVPADTVNTLTISNNKATGIVSTMIYTLEEGNVEGSVAFKDSTGKFLYAAGASSNNYMKTQDNINGNASFILNSDGTIVAQGSGDRNYMRYNNTGASNLFSCYASDSETGNLVTFYKRIGGSSYVDLPSVRSFAKLQARETIDGGDLVVDQVSLEFGARISVSDWDALNNALGIEDYGVMLFRTTEARLSTVLSVEEYFELGEQEREENEPNPEITIVNKGSATAPTPVESTYEFSVRINISTPSKFNRYYCVAPFIKAGGQYYFLEEKRESVNTLAENYSGNELSDDALLYLMETH